MDSTAPKEKATGEKRPATALELGTYALSRSFSHASHGDRPRSSVPHRSYVHMSPFPLELWSPYRLLNNVYIVERARRWRHCLVLRVLRARIPCVSRDLDCNGGKNADLCSNDFTWSSSSLPSSIHVRAIRETKRHRSASLFL